MDLGNRLRTGLVMFGALCSMPLIQGVILYTGQLEIQGIQEEHQLRVDKINRKYDVKIKEVIEDAFRGPVYFKDSDYLSV